MSPWTTLSSAWDSWRTRQAERPFSGPVPVDGKVVGWNSNSSFEPEESYFSVRLVEIYLSEDGKYFADFLPLGVCVAEYTRGAERQKTPLILSNEYIESMIGQQGLKAGSVQYKNVYVVRTAPVKSDNLALFVGLFRVEINDIARELIQMAAEVTEEVGGAALGSSLRVAEKVYDRVAGLFNLKGVQPRFGQLNGNALEKSGYVLIAGAPERQVAPASLRVFNDRLYSGEGEHRREVRGFDYCLIAIEHVSSLFDAADPNINRLTNRSFHKRYQEARKLLSMNKKSDADQEMLNLRAELVTSSDLTEDDRLLAIMAYEASYRKYADKFVPAPETRSATAEALSTEALRRRQSAPGVADALDGLVTSLQQLDDETLMENPDRLILSEAAFLSKQLKAIRPRPPIIQVAEALSVANAREEASK